MDETPEIDWLDRQLREAVPYIDDDGFSRRVLQHLPARRSNLQRVRSFIIFGATLMACLIAYLLSDRGQFVLHAVNRMAGMSPLMLVGIAMLAGILITLAGTAAVVSRNNQQGS
jgi:hypothetical protein